MGDIFAIVLVPTEAGRALLADGPCGARAPWLAYHAESGTWRNDWLFPPIRGRALPLWWDGKPVPEGWDRAERVWVAAYPRRCRTSDTEFSVSQALLLAEGVERDGLCRVVVLDLVDGAAVERGGGSEQQP